MAFRVIINFTVVPDLSGTSPGAAMRAGLLFWAAVNTTRVYRVKRDFQAVVEQPTIYQERCATQPWLQADAPEDDVDDIEFARTWAREHQHADSLAVVQTPTP